MKAVTVPKDKAPTRLFIRDIMTRNPIAVDRATTTRELARILVDNEISGVPVIDERDRVIGVVSRADLLLRFLQGPRPSEMPSSFLESLAEGEGLDLDFDPDRMGVVEEFMTPDPVTVAPDEMVSEVARIMAEEGVHRVPVVDEQDRLLGIVTTLDILRVYPR